MSGTGAGKVGTLARRALAVALLACGAAPALGQGHTPDPYNIVGEYNSQYEPYVYASEPTTDGVVPNQNEIEGRGNAVRNANRFQNYLDSLDGPSDGAAARAAQARPNYGAPFFQAHREADPLSGPNRAADKGYYDNQRKRNQSYFEAVREADPRKRAQLFRDLNQKSLKASRNLPDSRAAVARRGADPFGVEIARDGDEADAAEEKPLATPRRATTPARRGAASPATRTAPTTPRGGAPRPPASLFAPSEDVLERSRRMDRGPLFAPTPPAGTTATRRPATPNP